MSPGGVGAVENLQLIGAGDFFGYGSFIANLIIGNVGNNALYGLYGNDTLVGGDGHDSLNGEDQNDRLEGGAGVDTLTGGFGADRFVFTSVSDTGVAAQADTITDFNQTESDKIDLFSIDADVVADENQAFNFIESAAFSGVAGELRFDTAIFSLLGDVDGDLNADFQIMLTGITNLTNGDLIL